MGWCLANSWYKKLFANWMIAFSKKKTWVFIMGGGFQVSRVGEKTDMLNWRWGWGDFIFRTCKPCPISTAPDKELFKRERGEEESSVAELKLKITVLNILGTFNLNKYYSKICSYLASSQEVPFFWKYICSSMFELTVQLSSQLTMHTVCPTCIQYQMDQFSN
jgi:hypothetical protein